MRKIESIAYTVGSQFLALIEYGEANGLTDDEEQQWDKVNRKARDNPPDGFHFGHWSIGTESKDEFTRCEVTGLMGQCYTVNAVYFEGVAI